MADRFYQLTYKNNPNRLPVLEDIGTYLSISGLVFQGMGTNLVLFVPGAEVPVPEELVMHAPDLNEWADIIKRSDNPEIFIGEEGGIKKVLHRKQRYSISGEVQQKIWVRDNCQCQYCGAKMGKSLMTIDHWYPMELGGANDESNYLTACRRCNKAKGNMLPKDFCELKGYDYNKLNAYVASFGNNKVKSKSI